MASEKAEELMAAASERANVPIVQSLQSFAEHLLVRRESKKIVIDF